MNPSLSQVTLEKPLKRLSLRNRVEHRAEAAVLMRPLGWPCRMTALGALALLIAGLTAVSGQPYSRLGSIVAGGGGTGGNGQYSLSGTAGQAVTGAQTDGHFTLLGGFWSFVASNQASPPVLLNPILWTNKAGGHWNVASNWSPNQTPGPGDTAMLNGGYSCTVTVDDATTVGNLTLGAGVTLAGPGKLTVNGSLNWTGGNLTGWLQCNGGAVSGSAAHYQYGGQLVNAGTLTLNASITTGYAAGITNLPGAVFDLTSDVGITYYTGARGAIYNQGTFRKSGGLGVSALTEPFSNTGTVDVETGTLSLGFGGNGSGLFQATSGATLAFGNPATQSGSTFTLAPGANVSGAGALLVCGGTANLAGTVNLTGSHTFSAGTATLSGPYWMTNGILTISGGAANFTGTGLITPAQLELSAGVLGGTTLVMVTGPLHWTGGNLTGWLQCNGGTVIGSAGHYQYGGQLVNAGTLTLNSSITTGYAAAITNLPGAVFDLAADVGISYYTGVRGAIYNQGAFRKSGGLGVSTLTEPFSNAGTVDVQTGTLSLGFGGNGSGLFQAASGATLAFGNPASLSGSTFNLALGATVSGAGGLLVCGGTANLAGTVNLTGNHTFSAGAATLSGPYWMTNGILTISGGTANFTGTGLITPAQLELSAGVLGGTTPVVVTGPLHWTGGNLTGWLQCNGGAVSGSAGHYQYGGQLVNAGTLTLNASITTGYAAGITNLPGAVFDLAADVGISYYTGVRGAIYNQGAFRKSGGLGVSVLTEPFSNAGALEARSGTLEFGQLLTQTAGQTWLLEGRLTVGHGLALVGGMLAGTNTLTGNVTNSGGMVSPGASAGVLTIAGHYAQTSGGTLRIELGGPTPGSGFDQLAVSGTATLGGALDVSFIQGFTPPANSAYNFLMAGSRAGVFASFSPPLAQLGLTLDYATNGATLGVTGLSSPTISLPWLTNKTLVLFWPSSAASYQLEAALDLLRGPSWVVIPSSLYQTNGETIQYVEPVAATGGRFFRLRKTAPSGP